MSTKPGALRRGAVGRTRTPGFVQAGEPGAPKCAAGHRTRPEAPDMAPAASLLTNVAPEDCRRQQSLRASGDQAGECRWRRPR